MVDSVCDWLLYYNLSLVEEGLVTGPINSATLQSLLFFCFIGTIVSAVDIANKLYDLWIGHPFVDAGYTEFCVMLFEDIPQLVIGLVVILCAVGTASLLATIKAIFVMIGPVVNMTVIVRDKKMQRKVPGHKTKSLLAGRVIGNTVIFVLAGTTYLYVFINWASGLKFPAADERELDNNWSNISYTYNSSNQYNNQSHDFTSNQIDFDLPDRPEYRDENGKYFSKVGIYLDTDELPFPTKGVRNKEWIKFFDINEIQLHREITTQVMTNWSHIRLQNFYTGNSSDTCYTSGLNETFYDFTKTTDCELLDGTKLHYRFKYLQPSARHVMGNIKYNVRKTPVDSCENIALPRIPRLKYFKEDRYYNEDASGHFYGRLFGNDSAYRFYTEWDLIEIKNVWRKRIETLDMFLTFFNLQVIEPYYCAYTGSVSPHFDPDIAVLCQP